jgi:hypothetical protein
LNRATQCSMPRGVIGLPPYTFRYAVSKFYSLEFLSLFFHLGLWYLSNKFLIKPGYRDQVSCPENVLHAIYTYLGSFRIFINLYQVHWFEIQGWVAK